MIILKILYIFVYFPFAVTEGGEDGSEKSSNILYFSKNVYCTKLKHKLFFLRLLFFFTSPHTSYKYFIYNWPKIPFKFLLSYKLNVYLTFNFNQTFVVPTPWKRAFS